MKFEAESWRSECGEFCILLTPFYQPYRACDEREGVRPTERVEQFDTFDQARQWCESRAAAGQGEAKS